MNEDIERPHSVDRAVLYTRQIATGRKQVPDTAVTCKALPTQLKRQLAHIRKHQGRCTRRKSLRPAPGSRADLEHRHTLGNPLRQDFVDQRTLPLGRGIPLIPATAPIISRPITPMIGRTSPAPMRQAKPPATLLQRKKLILNRPTQPPYDAAGDHRARSIFRCDSENYVVDRQCRGPDDTGMPDGTSHWNHLSHHGLFVAPSKKSGNRATNTAGSTTGMSSSASSKSRSTDTR